MKKIHYFIELLSKSWKCLLSGFSTFNICSPLSEIESLSNKTVEEAFAEDQKRLRGDWQRAVAKVSANILNSDEYSEEIKQQWREVMKMEKEWWDAMDKQL